MFVCSLFFIEIAEHCNTCIRNQTFCLDHSLGVQCLHCVILHTHITLCVSWNAVTAQNCQIWVLAGLAILEVSSKLRFLALACVPQSKRALDGNYRAPLHSALRCCTVSWHSRVQCSFLRHTENSRNGALLRCNVVCLALCKVLRCFQVSKHNPLAINSPEIVACS